MCWWWSNNDDSSHSHHCSWWYHNANDDNDGSTYDTAKLLHLLRKRILVSSDWRCWELFYQWSFVYLRKRWIVLDKRRVVCFPLSDHNKHHHNYNNDQCSYNHTVRRWRVVLS